MMLPKISFSSTPISTNTDSVVQITSEQLKYANLIFVEHKKLKTENQLLYNQLENYNSKIFYLEQQDTIRQQQMYVLDNSYKQQLSNLNKDLNKKDSQILYWKIGGIAISATLVLLLVLWK